jgi:Fe-S-cluster containining protein
MMALTRKEEIWLACKQKTCCYAAFVLPSGRDVWRISRTLQAPPSTFLVYFESPQPQPDAFILDASGLKFRLALSKQQSRRTKSAPPCIFLMKTRQGHHRCGLGDLRPQVCRSFPSEIADGLVRIDPDTGCTCRKWSLSDVDIDEEKSRVEQRLRDYNEYCAVVQHWNQQAATELADAPPGMGFDFYDYLDFLLEAYDEISA